MTFCHMGGVISQTSFQYGIRHADSTTYMHSSKYPKLAETAKLGYFSESPERGGFGDFYGSCIVRDTPPKMAKTPFSGDFEFWTPPLFPTPPPSQKRGGVPPPLFCPPSWPPPQPKGRNPLWGGAPPPFGGRDLCKIHFWGVLGSVSRRTSGKGQKRCFWGFLTLEMRYSGMGIKICVEYYIPLCCALTFIQVCP